MYVCVYIYISQTAFCRKSESAEEKLYHLLRTFSWNSADIILNIISTLGSTGLPTRSTRDQDASLSGTLMERNLELMTMCSSRKII
jgi:hypothetical protein